MAKPNYAFAKRQRDLAKKAKKEEKRLRKAAGGDETADEADAPDAAAPDGAEQAPDATPAPSAEHGGEK